MDARTKRGRRTAGHDASTTIPLSSELRKRVDAWAAKQSDKPTRPEAILRLVELGLETTHRTQKWNQRCLKLAPRGSKNPEQYLTKEQQKACLDSAAAELIREITQERSLN